MGLVATIVVPRMLWWVTPLSDYTGYLNLYIVDTRYVHYTCYDLLYFNQNFTPDCNYSTSTSMSHNP